MKGEPKASILHQGGLSVVPVLKGKGTTALAVGLVVSGVWGLVLIRIAVDRF